MPRAFDITPVTSSVKLDGTRKGTFQFKVSNALGKKVQVKVRVVPENPSDSSAGWLTPDPSEKELIPSETQVFQVQVAVPKDAPAGEYRFHLSAANVANPDEEYVDGPSVAFTVPQEEKGRPFPWWIVIVAAAVLMVGGGVLVYFLVIHKKSVVVGTACQMDTNCSSNQKCVTIAPGSKACLLKPAESCAQDRDCSSFWCSDQKCSRDDGHCETPADCRAPIFACAANVCLKTNGQSCAANEECQSGSCNSGTCGRQATPCAALCAAGSICISGRCVRIKVDGTFRFDPNAGSRFKMLPTVPR